MPRETRLGFRKTLANRFDTLCPKFLVSPFWKNQAALPIVIAFEQNKNAAATNAAKRATHDGSFVRQFGQTKPEDVHRRSCLGGFEACQLADHGEAAIGADCQGRAEFVFSVRPE